MAIEVTINLDSGCFLPTEPIKARGFSPTDPIKKEKYSCRVGYFQNPPAIPDIRVFVDSDELELPEPLKLGCENCTIDVIHRNADGSAKSDGVKVAKTFHGQLLHLKDLYGEDIDMDPAKFDCIFRFESGRLLPSMIKSRGFKESKKDEYGKFASTGKRKEHDPVSHNVIVHFMLEKGEVLEFSKDGKVLLSSADLGVKRRLEIEVPVDNSVANKFYHDGFLKTRPDNVYWLPNDGDPPPNCPCPPCPEPELG